METKRVLIVDDDPESVRMAVSLLRDEPYRLLWSDEPAAALALAHTHLPDLILLSWTLPDMTGDEFAEQLASHRETADIPIVLVSLEPWLFAPSLRERATQVINRTFMDAELAPRVREALGLEPSPWLSPPTWSAFATVLSGGRARKRRLANGSASQTSVYRLVACPHIPTDAVAACLTDGTAWQAFGAVPRPSAVRTTVVSPTRQSPPAESRAR
ncbi:MAG: response regulator [Chloroflexia bacterium]